MFRSVSSVIGVCMMFCLCLGGLQAQDNTPIINPDNAEEIRLLGTFWQRLDEYRPYYAAFVSWQLSNTGKWLVSKHANCRKLDTFQVWSLETLQSKAQYRRASFSCEGPYTGIQFSADDHFLAAYSQCSHTDCGFQVWDLNTDRSVFSATVPQFNQDGVAITSSGLLTVTFSDMDSIRVYDIVENSDSEIRIPDEDEGWQLRYTAGSPDGTLLAVQESDVITLLQFPERTIVGTFGITQRTRTDMRFTDDSRYLILELYYRSRKSFWMDRLGGVIKWDIEAGEIVGQYELQPERNYSLIVSRNADYLFRRENNHVELIHTASGSILASYDDERIRCPELALFPCARFNDDESIVAWLGDDTIRIANMMDGSIIAKLPIGPGIRYMDFIPHTSVFVTFIPLEHHNRQRYPICQMQLWNAETGSGIGSPLQGLCGYIAISPDGTSIITADQQTAMVFGVPSETRPAYTSVPAHVVPSAITVRAQPHPNAEEIGFLSGVTVVGGIDATGQYLYIPNSDGWVRSGASYIDLAPHAALEQLPVVPG